MRFDVENEILN